MASYNHQQKIVAQEVIEYIKQHMKGDVNEKSVNEFLEAVGEQFEFSDAENWAYNYVLREMRNDASAHGTIFRTAKKWVEIMGLSETEARRLGMALTRLSKEGMIVKQKGEGKGAVMEYAVELPDSQ